MEPKREQRQDFTQVVEVRVRVSVPALPRLRNGALVGMSRDLTEARARQAERLATETARQTDAHAMRDRLVAAVGDVATLYPDARIAVETTDPWHGRRKAVD